jgi:DNA polymerase III alpha subunit
MNYDQYGQCWTTPEELCNMLYQTPDLPIDKFLVKMGGERGSVDAVQYNESVEEFFADFPRLKYIRDIELPVEEFHHQQQEHWHMPDEYKRMDIAKWLLDECKSQAELQRVGEELLLYQERDLFDLLRYLKYMVDTFRKNNVVWGLGRGSSVASFALYLIGVHKINSMYYDLNINEFLK